MNSPALLRQAVTALVAATGQPGGWHDADELARLAVPKPDRPAPIGWGLRGRVGVLTVRRFDGDAGAQLRKAVEAMMATAGTPPRGVFIDLRDDEGGLFDAEIHAADLLHHAGEIGVQRGRGPSDLERHVAQQGDLLRGTALRVLVNGRTAAGAEIFAGALQRNSGARLVGGRTYGRGTVQTLMMGGNVGALRLTTSEFRLTGDQPLDKFGPTPDRLVQPTPETPEAVLDAAIAEFSG